MIAPAHRTVRRCVRFFLPAGLGAALIVLATLPATANASYRDARRAAMGQVGLVAGGGDAALNPAYHAFDPVEPAPRVIPLPLGILQLVAAPPSLDPDDPDFSLPEVVNLALNPPYDLVLRDAPSGAGSTITLEVGEDYMAIDLGDGRALVPDQHSRWGSTLSSSLWSSAVGGMIFSMAPVMTGKADLDMSDDLHGVLSNAEPVSSQGDYSMDGDGEVGAAMGMGVTFAQQFAGEDLRYSDPERGWRTYGGVTFKYLMGMAYMRSESEFDVIVNEPLLDPNNPSYLEFGTTVRHALPGVTGGVGQGFAMDLGIATMLGDSFEMGVGVQNLAGSIRWQTDVDRIELNNETGELETQPVARGASYTSKVPPTWSVSAARRFDRGLTLASDLRHGPGGASWHLGGEQWLGPMPLRAGLVIDSNGQPQWSGGSGVRFGPVGIDLAVYSVGASLSGDRALMLGSSLVLY